MKCKRTVSNKEKINGGNKDKLSSDRKKTVRYVFLEKQTQNMSMKLV